MPDKQHLLALERANEVRYAVARMRSSIRAAGPRAGALKAIDVIRAAESPIRIFHLLRAIPRIGHGHARRMCLRAQINPEARVNSSHITDRQRTHLIGQLVAFSHGEDRH